MVNKSDNFGCNSRGSDYKEPCRPFFPQPSFNYSEKIDADIFTINREIEMFRVQRIQIPYSERLFEICQLAKRLRNRAVFVGRQVHFFRTRKTYADLSRRYPDLAKRILAFMETKLDDPDLTDELKRKLQNPALELSETVRKALGKFEQFGSLDEFLKFESVYKDLSAIYSPLPQQVLKYVANSWSSYYEAHTSWENNQKLFEAEPRIPSTKRKEKEFLLSFSAGTFINYKDLISTENKKMGYRQRQSFAHIPFLKLIEMIKYKAELVGINVVIINESHTFKCSAIDFELVKHHEPDEYVGVRGVSRSGKNKKKLIKEGYPEIKIYKARGLFKTRDGYIIHSDVNGSYNIGRRAFPDLFNTYTLSKRTMLKSPISVQIA
jgi:hypothetical protein